MSRSRLLALVISNSSLLWNNYWYRHRSLSAGIGFSEIWSPSRRIQFGTSLPLALAAYVIKYEVLCENHLNHLTKLYFLLVPLVLKWIIPTFPVSSSRNLPILLFASFYGWNVHGGSNMTTWTIPPVVKTWRQTKTLINYQLWWETLKRNLRWLNVCILYSLSAGLMFPCRHSLHLYAWHHSALCPVHAQLTYVLVMELHIMYAQSVYKKIIL